MRRFDGKTWTGKEIPDDIDLTAVAGNGDALTPSCVRPPVFSLLLCGNRDVLWVVNGVELLTFDGERWLQTPRIGHENGPPPKRVRTTKKSAASAKPAARTPRK